MRPEVSGTLLSVLLDRARGLGVNFDRLLADMPEDLEEHAQPHRFISFEVFDRLLVMLSKQANDTDLPERIGREFMTHAEHGLGRLVLPIVDSPAEVIEQGAKFLDSSIRPLTVIAQPSGRNAFMLTCKLDERLPLEQTFTQFLKGAAWGILDLVDARLKRLSVMDLQIAVERYRPDLRTRYEIGSGGNVFELVSGSKAAKSAVTRRLELGALAADGTFAIRGVRLGAPRSTFALHFRPKRRLFARLALRLTGRRGGPRIDELYRAGREELRRDRKLMVGLQRRIEVQGRTSETVNQFLESIKAVADLSGLLQLMATATCGPFGFDRSLIFLVRDNSLKVVSSHNPYDGEWAQVSYANLQSSPIDLSQDLYESQVMSTGIPLAVANAAQSPRVPMVLKSAWSPNHYAIVPIRGRDRTIGLLLVDHHYRKREISQDDLEVLGSMSNIAGLALDKLLLIGSLEEKVDERTRALSSANKKLTELYQRAKESERLKSMFLANVSHELRTPLNSIIGFSKVVLKGIDGEINDRQRQDLTAIHNDGVHLLGVINDILDLTKIEAGHMELHAGLMDLEPTVRDVIQTAAGLLGDKPIEMTCEINRNLPQIWADKMRVRQILLNLMSNAIKFTDRGSIKISASPRPREILVSVSDTGRGMSADEIPVAFAEFRQLDDSPGRRAGGTGLGLTITKRLVEMHGGRIWVNSAPGSGSTFFFTLPAGPPEAGDSEARAAGRTAGGAVA